MPLYSCWVHLLFRDVLISYCDEYFQSSDWRQQRTWSTLITKVSQVIVDIAQEQTDVSVPDDFEEVS